MKTSSSITELVIVLAFMIAAVPLLLMLMVQCNNSTYSYLDDKTTYGMSDSIELIWDEQSDTYVPRQLATINLDFGGALCIALVQDDYCPEQGKVVEYFYEADTTEYPIPPDNPTTGYTAMNYILTIKEGWDSKKYNTFERLINNACSYSNFSTYSNSNLYLVWNAERDTWMLTSKFINIYD